MDILEALATLDAGNDEQWTTDGLPKVDVVAELVDNEKLKRADIIEAAPDFNRDAAKAAAELKTDDTVLPPAADAKPVGDDTKASNEDNDATPKETEETTEEVEVERPKTLLEQVEEAFVEAQNELNEIGKESARLNEMRKDLEVKVGYLGGQVDRLKKDTNANQSAIQAYLENNRKIAAEKAAARKALLESGIGDLMKSVGPTALDAAMKQRKPTPSNVRREYPRAIAR